MTPWFQTLQQNLISLKTVLASRCSPLGNSSKLPNFSYKSGKQTSNIKRKEENLNLIIYNSNPNKSNEWDVSILMM